MALNVTESNAAFSLAHYLTEQPGPAGEYVSDDQARDALDLLLQSAGKRLLLSGEPSMRAWPAGGPAPIASRR